MDQGLIPRRYAKALYEVGEDRHDNDTLYVLMERLRAAFAGTPGLCATVANPFVTPDDKKKLILTAVYGSDGVAPDKTFEDFLTLLTENDRMDIARDIAIAFIGLYRLKHGIYKVEICSAAPMGKPNASVWNLLSPTISAKAPWNSTILSIHPLSAVLPSQSIRSVLTLPSAMN